MQNYTGNIYKIKEASVNISKYLLAISEPDSSELLECIECTSSSDINFSCEESFLVEIFPKNHINDNSMFVDCSKRVYIEKNSLLNTNLHIDSSNLSRVLKKIIQYYSNLHYSITHSKITHNNITHVNTTHQYPRIPYAGRVFDTREINNLIDSSLDFWLTSGKYCEEFEKKLSQYLNISYCLSVNSGSSANLLAFMALTSPKLADRRILPGDEVITVSAGFPTTVSPIIQYGAIPVFVDISIPSYNIDTQAMQLALSSKTKAVMIAHTLGNPFNVNAVRDFCTKNNLWLIEDNCDALGAQYKHNNYERFTGTFADIGTSSFYPPHHITTGEGGAVYTNNPELHKIMLSLRDWGRDCICPSGQDNLCNNRFNKQYGELPIGYDHKYVYSHFGYNLKMTDMQAAIGCAQLDKLPSFVEARNRNWEFYKKSFAKLEEYFILPQKEEFSTPSWFGFMITLKENCPFDRKALIDFLESRNIQTRMLFAGNIIRQPCFDAIRHDEGKYRAVGNLNNTNYIMNNSFFIGVYPGITPEMTQYVTNCVFEFCKIKNPQNLDSNVFV